MGRRLTATRIAPRSSLDHARPGVTTRTSVHTSFALVGLSGYRLNQAIVRHLTQVGSLSRDRSVQVLSRRHQLEQRLGPEVIAQLVADYQVGRSTAELANELGVAKSAVLAVLRRAGVQIRLPRLTPQELDRMTALYRQGVSQVEIASQLGRTPGAIWHALNRMGLVGRQG